MPKAIAVMLPPESGADQASFCVPWKVMSPVGDP
jgi:hypothetical protein